METLPVIAFAEHDAFATVTRDTIDNSPKNEGVYCLLADVDDALCVLYVGTAANIRSRLTQHLRHDAPWTSASFQELWELYRWEEEMRLLWNYLPPWNKAYNPNKTFVQLTKVVWDVCMFGLYPEISQGLALSTDEAAAERKLRSLLKHSGIDRKIHQRIDGQFRALLKRDSLDCWMKDRIGVSYSDLEKKRNEEREKSWEEHRQQAITRLLTNPLTPGVFRGMLESDRVQPEL